MSLRLPALGPGAGPYSNGVGRMPAGRHRVCLPAASGPSSSSVLHAKSIRDLILPFFSGGITAQPKNFSCNALALGRSFAQHAVAPLPTAQPNIYSCSALELDALTLHLLDAQHAVALLPRVECKRCLPRARHFLDPPSPTSCTELAHGSCAALRSALLGYPDACRSRHQHRPLLSPTTPLILSLLRNHHERCESTCNHVGSFRANPVITINMIPMHHPT